jgi:hypothetical protein
MPRYFFHVVTTELFADAEGKDLLDLDQARAAAKSKADDFAEIAAGGRIDIADEHGKIVAAVPVPAI